MLERTIAVINGKGGVGKTSITTNLGALVAAAGYRVLVVDLDPQGNAGRDLGVTDTPDDDQGSALFAAVATGVPLRPVASVRERLDLVCGGERIEEMVGALDARANRAGAATVATAVRDALAPTAADYDLIVIDCPPGGQKLQRMALTAAQYALIPTKSDAASLDGLVKVAHLFADVTATSNPHLSLLGVALFGIGPSAKRIAREARDTVARDLGDPDLVFEATIRHAEGAAVAARNRGRLMHELEEALPGERKAYFEQLRRNAGGKHRADKPAPRIAASSATLAADYQALAAEVLDRIAARAGATS